MIDSDQTVLEAMTTMRDHRVRRLFLRGREGEFVSDGSILAYLFTPRAITLAKESPRSWTGAKLSRIRPTKARRVSPTATVGELATMIQSGIDAFTLAGGAFVVTKWDLVMKPWKAGQISLSF